MIMGRFQPTARLADSGTTVEIVSYRNGNYLVKNRSGKKYTVPEHKVEIIRDCFYGLVST